LKALKDSIWVEKKKNEKNGNDDKDEKETLEYPVSCMTLEEITCLHIKATGVGVELEGGDRIRVRRGNQLQTHRRFREFCYGNLIEKHLVEAGKIEEKKEKVNENANDKAKEKEKEKEKTKGKRKFEDNTNEMLMSFILEWTHTKEKSAYGFSHTPMKKK
jgi:hypothetical protein